MSAPEYQLELAEPAQEDFNDLLSFTMQTWGEEQLTAYATKIDAALAAVTKNPQSGRKRHGVMCIRPDGIRFITAFRIRPFLYTHIA